MSPIFKQQYMLEMVEARKTSTEVEERHDLFSGLLNASQDELDNGTALSDDELIGKYSNTTPFFAFETSLCSLTQEMYLCFFSLDTR
jgi:hypothetical protein